jgi:rhodanese-related sulfurtransferase
MAEPLELSALDVKRKLDAGESFNFVDVREPEEFAMARIEGARLIPMRSVPAALAELDDDRPVVVFCHHGVRSLQVANWLREHGIEQVWSMAGGIDLWSLQIDPSVKRY